MVLRRNQSVCKKRKRDGRTFRPIGFYPSFEAAVFLGALLAGAFASDAPADSFLGAAFFGAPDFLAGAFSFFSAASCLAFAGAFALRAAGFLAGLGGGAAREERVDGRLVAHEGDRQVPAGKADVLAQRNDVLVVAAERLGLRGGC